MSNSHLILFDGVCNFCNAAVNFIIKRDPKDVFRFSALQSHYAQGLMAQCGISEGDLDTLILIKDGACYYRSDAVLEITKDLSAYWALLSVFKIVPRVIRDAVYRLFARYRYRVFGKMEVCKLPTPEIRDKFME